MGYFQENQCGFWTIIGKYEVKSCGGYILGDDIDKVIVGSK
jgi:hypothetical protein